MFSHVTKLFSSVGKKAWIKPSVDWMINSNAKFGTVKSFGRVTPHKVSVEYNKQKSKFMSCTQIRIRLFSAATETSWVASKIRTQTPLKRGLSPGYFPQQHCSCPLRETLNTPKRLTTLAGVLVVITAAAQGHTLCVCRLSHEKILHMHEA